MTQRRTLQCPKCGAPLPPAAAREVVTCAFCAMASTPAPDSNAATAPPAIALATIPATATDLGCPRCGNTLFEGEASKVRLLGCGGCGGIWLDNESAQRALATFDRKVGELSARAATNASAALAVEPRVACPMCRKAMPRVRVPKTAIDLDVCATHGTWFDRGELAQVLDALRPRPAPALAPPSKIPVIDDRPLDPSEVPDFRAGTLTPGVAETGIVVGGAFAVLGALAALAGGSSK